eukprot:TRINITY_DN66440_c6_g1_i1.p2 TRINITY_DN66440_c6_g1~~TRINITY_DN66440_c6_g1_i1.p2  ORF type:complete len:762 (-),score=494.43 TRINITY_DN66440_c6_g1_i1:84-2267(-)
MSDANDANNNNSNNADADSAAPAAATAGSVAPPAGPPPTESKKEDDEFAPPPVIPDLGADTDKEYAPLQVETMDEGDWAEYGSRFGRTMSLDAESLNSEWMQRPSVIARNTGALVADDEDEDGAGAAAATTAGDASSENSKTEEQKQFEAEQDAALKEAQEAAAAAAASGDGKVKSVTPGSGSHHQLGEQLIKAAKKNDAEKVSSLLSRFVPVPVNYRSMKDAQELTALHFAARYGYLKVLELLLGANADVDIQDKGGRTPLHYACSFGEDSAAMMLLKHGANTDVQSKDGWTALLRACYNGHRECARALLSKDANADLANNNGSTAIHAASRKGSAKVVQLLIEKGCKVDVLNKFGWTGLHMAAEKGNEDVVLLLLEHGKSQDIASQDGRTALMLASENGHDRVVSHLLKAKADVTLKRQDGWTALHCAAYNGHARVVKFLLQQGKADPTVLTADGRTALHIASALGHTEVVDVLLANRTIKVDANRPQTKDKLTPLHLAAIQGHGDVIKLLVEAGGADVAIKDALDRTPLEVAQSAEAASALIAGGAYEELRVNGMEYIAKRKNQEIVEVLRSVLVMPGTVRGLPSLEKGGVDDKTREAIHEVRERGIEVKYMKGSFKMLKKLTNSYDEAHFFEWSEFTRITNSAKTPGRFVIDLIGNGRTVLTLFKSGKNPMSDEQMAAFLEKIRKMHVDPPLPLYWVKHVNDDGIPFYHNEVTGETQWEFPTQ